MRGVVCVEQLRAQFVAIVDVNIKTGCPEGLGPVVHGPSTKQTIFLYSSVFLVKLPPRPRLNWAKFVYVTVDRHTDSTGPYVVVVVVVVVVVHVASIVIRTQLGYAYIYRLYEYFHSS